MIAGLDGRLRTRPRRAPPGDRQLPGSGGDDRAALRCRQLLQQHGEVARRQSGVRRGRCTSAKFVERFEHRLAGAAAPPQVDEFAAIACSQCRDRHRRVEGAALQVHGDQGFLHQVPRPRRVIMRRREVASSRCAISRRKRTRVGRLVAGLRLLPQRPQPLQDTSRLSFIASVCLKGPVRLRRCGRFSRRPL